MASRKDLRGYALRTGESQRADGRYSFSYVDKLGKRHAIYAKTLVELRDREKKIQRDIEDGLDSAKAAQMTVNDLYDIYIAQKYDLKPSSKNNYIYCFNHFIRETFGKRRLLSVKYSHVKEFYYHLMREGGLQPNTLDNIHTQLHPAFQMAVRDELIRKNPSDGVIGEIKKSHIWVKKKRHALTIPQQRAFMNFLETQYEYRGWHPVITVLLGTGMRIVECLALTWDDLDFDNRTVSVNRT